MASSMRIVVAILSIVCALQAADSSNILGYFFSPSRSHYIAQETLMKALAAKGHNVSQMKISISIAAFDVHSLTFSLRIGDSRYSISNGQIEETAAKLLRIAADIGWF